MMQLWFWFGCVFHHDFVVTVPTVEFVLDGRLNRATLTQQKQVLSGVGLTHTLAHVFGRFLWPWPSLAHKLLFLRMSCRVVLRANARVVMHSIISMQACLRLQSSLLLCMCRPHSNAAWHVPTHTLPNPTLLWPLTHFRSAAVLTIQVRAQPAQQCR